MPRSKQKTAPTTRYGLPDEARVEQRQEGDAAIAMTRYRLRREAGTEVRASAGPAWESSDRLAARRGS